MPEAQGHDHGDDDGQRILGAQEPEQRKRKGRGEKRAEKIEDTSPEVVGQPAEQRYGRDLDQRRDENRVEQQGARQAELAGGIDDDEDGEDIDPGHLGYFQPDRHQEAAGILEHRLDEGIPGNVAPALDGLEHRRFRHPRAHEPADAEQQDAEQERDAPPPRLEVCVRHPCHQGKDARRCHQPEREADLHQAAEQAAPTCRRMLDNHE